MDESKVPRFYGPPCSTMKALYSWNFWESYHKEIVYKFLIWQSKKTCYAWA